jgi:hypothetical protein
MNVPLCLALLKALMSPFSEIIPPISPAPAISIASPPFLLGASPPTKKFSCSSPLPWLKNAALA